jgi:DNA invertase Pin-like site-specific DNA recombinase
MPASSPPLAPPVADQPRSIGYARVSTASQDETAQVAALNAAGCELVFHERVSTRTKDTERPQLQAALAALRPGDELVVPKLDRLGRTQVEVIVRLHDLQEQGVHVRTLDGLINTRALGKMAPLVIGLLTGLAEVERELIRERVNESIEYRRNTGGDLGGRRKSYTPEQAQLVKDLREAGDSLRTITRKVNLSLGAVQRILEGES